MFFSNFFQFKYYLLCLSSFLQSTLTAISSICPDAVCSYLYSVIHFALNYTTHFLNDFVKLNFCKFIVIWYFFKFHILKLLLRCCSWKYLWQYKVKVSSAHIWELGRHWEDQHLTLQLWHFPSSPCGSWKDGHQEAWYTTRWPPFRTHNWKNAQMTWSAF